MDFFSRDDAGLRLGQELLKHQIQADVVLGLPRGGVVVAAKVAELLRCPLDVIVVRKIGHPRHREFAVGALAEGDVVVLDSAAIESTHVVREELDDVIAEENHRLQEYQLKFRADVALELSGKTVVLVDDGLATGATMEAAVASARKRAAGKVIVAVPVASETAFHRLNRTADQLVSVLIDPTFSAVGRYYEHFSQTSDEEVVALLRP